MTTIHILTAEHLDGALVIHTAEHGPRYVWPIGSDALGPIRDIDPRRLAGATLTINEEAAAVVVGVSDLQPERGE